jgi:iron-sulfur cluster repair protein YtfE (RIC family)
MCAQDCFDMLQEFHDKIRTALIPMAQCIETLESTGKWGREHYTILQKFKTFHETDVATHTRDEEIAFYPILGQRWREIHSAETIHTPTECMLREHTDIFAHVHAFGVLVDILQMQPANSVALETLIGECRAILTILPLHMQKEEQFLFPKAREILPQSEIDAATQLICSLRQAMT